MNFSVTLSQFILSCSLNVSPFRKGDNVISKPESFSNCAGRVGRLVGIAEGVDVGNFVGSFDTDGE